MRRTWIASAAMTLGVSALIPTMAKADDRHDDRNHGRVEQRSVRQPEHFDRHYDHRDVRSDRVVRNDRVRVERDVRVVREVVVRPEIRYVPAPTYIARPVEICIEPDFDMNVSFNDVPDQVRFAVQDQIRGARIESIQYVRRDGKLFYRFRADDGRHLDQNFRFSPDGRLLSVEAVG